MSQFRDLIQVYRSNIDANNISAEVAVDMFIDTLSALEWDIEVHMDYVDHEDYNSYMQEERKAAQKLLGV